MAKFNWIDITREDVIGAIEKFLADNPEYPEPRSTFLVYKCYQCGKNRTAQVVKANDGFWGIDLERTSGPEAIWKNKQGMRASWRTNYEWLVENAETLYNGD